MTTSPAFGRPSSSDAAASDLQGGNSTSEGPVTVAGGVCLE